MRRLVPGGAAGAAMFPRRRPMERTTFGRVFGASRHEAARWEAIGAIRPTVDVGPKRRGYRWADVLRFAADPATWHLWRLEDVADAEVYAHAARRRGGVAWATAAEAAAALGYCKGRLEQLCRLGHLAGLAERRDGRWYVRADRLAEARAAVSAATRPAPYTPERRAVVVRLLAEGATLEGVARALGLRSTGSSRHWRTKLARAA